MAMKTIYLQLVLFALLGIQISSTLPRVKSKHIFNNQLKGLWDEEALENDNKAKLALKADPELNAMFERMGEPGVDCKVFANSLNILITAVMKRFKPLLQPFVHQCNHAEFKIPIEDGNDFEVPVLVHTPKTLTGKKPAFIYAHAGLMAGSAILFKPWMSLLATATGVVVFNVDYRLAPAAKFPKNANDFYYAVKYIIKNADKLGIDASRIGLFGESGGANLVFSTMVMLAQRDEGHLIKLAMPSVPMISDYAFGDMASMTKEERESAPGVRNAWRCLSNDLDRERNNPRLFPAKASDEILQKMPPTIIIEKEFDSFITEATRMTHRMRVAGRLLEFYVMPGLGQSSFSTTTAMQYFKDIKRMLKEYFW